MKPSTTASATAAGLAPDCAAISGINKTSDIAAIAVDVGHLQSDAHLDHRSVPGDRADARGVVRTEQVPVAAGDLPGHRRGEIAHGRDRSPAPDRRGTPTGIPRKPSPLSDEVSQDHDRPGEPGVVHRALPAVTGQVAGGIVAVLGDQHRFRAGPRRMVARISLATALVSSCWPYRPVMLATSIRQPSRSNGGAQPARDHRVAGAEHPIPQRPASPGRTSAATGCPSQAA